MEASCYKNQVRLRGLTKNLDFSNLLPAGFVCVAAVLTAKLTVKLTPMGKDVRNRGLAINSLSEPVKNSDIKQLIDKRED